MIQVPEADYERMRAIVNAAEAWADGLSLKSHAAYSSAVDDPLLTRTLIELYRAVKAMRERQGAA